MSRLTPPKITDKRLVVGQLHLDLASGDSRPAAVAESHPEHSDIRHPAFLHHLFLHSESNSVWMILNVFRIQSSTSDAHFIQSACDEGVYKNCLQVLMQVASFSCFSVLLAATSSVFRWSL
jgi:hypothetical protein